MREMEIVTLGAADGLVGPRPVPPGEAGEGVKHASAHSECLNCGTLLHGRYCSTCGQTDDDHHRSIFHLLWEAVEGLTHLDGRLAKTLPPLFLNPGKLARDHFEGRRQRHVPPFRLFLITLLVFMFSLEFAFQSTNFAGKVGVPGVDGVPKLGQTLVTKDDAGHDVTVRMPTAADISEMTGGRISADEVQRRVDLQRAQAMTHDAGPAKDQGDDDKDDGQPKAATPAQPATTNTTAAAPAQAPGGANKGFNVRIGPRPAHPAGPGVVVTSSDDGKADDPRVSWFKRQIVKVRDNPELFKSLVFEWGHRLAILLLPIFALLLTGCYFYKRQFYVYDHLVVSMHFLSFTFLLWALVYLIPEPVKGWLMIVAVFWTPVNLYMTLRGAYGSTRIGAGIKAFSLWIATQLLFMLTLLGVLGVAVGQL